jgi:hypothetical protein
MSLHIKYFQEGDEPGEVLVVFTNEELRNHNNGNYQAYSPMEGHVTAQKEYVDGLREITLDEYKEQSKNFYTPREYVDTEGGAV